MSEASITVLTCCDDRADVLEPTLCSVLDQGAGELEAEAGAQGAKT